MVKINDPYIQKQSRVFHDACLVQIWWFQLKFVAIYHADKAKITDGQKDGGTDRRRQRQYAFGPKGQGVKWLGTIISWRYVKLYAYNWCWILRPWNQYLSEPYNEFRRTFTLWKNYYKRHWYGLTLARVMACCMTIPNHYLNQCWVTFSRAQWHTSEDNFKRDTSCIKR